MDKHEMVLLWWWMHEAGRYTVLDDIGMELSRCLLLNVILCMWCQIDPKPCTPRGMQPEKSRTKEGWVRKPEFFISQPRFGVSAGGGGGLFTHEKTQTLGVLF